MFDGCINSELLLSSLPSTLINSRAMFRNCKQSLLSLSTLPNDIISAGYMFQYCSGSTLPINNLPDLLIDADRMFDGCSNATFDITELANNAPENGWTNLTNISYMFNGCSKITGSKSAFLAKCPSGVTGSDTAFDNCPLLTD